MTRGRSWIKRSSRPARRSPSSASTSTALTRTRSIEASAYFDDVQGLKRGAPVNMGGVRVGKVSKVTYGDKATDTAIYVTLDIVTSRREDFLIRKVKG